MSRMSSSIGCNSACNARQLCKLVQKREIKFDNAIQDGDSFVIPSEREQDVDGYMKEMRENDRL